MPGRKDGEMSEKNGCPSKKEELVLQQCESCGERHFREALTRSPRDGVLLCGPCLSEEVR